MVLCFFPKLNVKNTVKIPAIPSLFERVSTMSKLKVFCTTLLVIGMGYTSSTYALFGLGAHYSLDFSVNMDAQSEQLLFDDLNLTTDGFTGTFPAAWNTQTITPENIPIYFDRGQMGRTPFGLGAKVYVDIIPFIDCIEIGGGFTAFQYDGRIIYPSSIEVLDPSSMTPDELLAQVTSGQRPNLATVTYDTLSTNIEDLDGAPPIPGITQTPYAKIDLGLTLRKYIPVPLIDNFFRPYGGLGFDVVLATPVPSAGLVRDALGDDLSGDKSVVEIMAVMQGDAAQKVVDEIIARLITPHFGMNVAVGFMVKPPIMPIGLYVDAKYAIPFGKLDEDANVTGSGFKINAGLCLHFGKKRT